MNSTKEDTKMPTVTFSFWKKEIQTKVPYGQGSNILQNENKLNFVFYAF